MVRLEQVQKSFKTLGGTLPVLRGISLDVPQGQFTAITGASGSGKSTLLSLIGCLDRPSTGRVFVNDVEANRLSDDAEADLRNKGIGFIFQAFHLIQSLSLLENVEVPLFYGGMPRGERRRKATEALQRVGLAERITHRPFELSGGEQQRAAIARALIWSPRLILADEPTGNLDSKTCTTILEILCGLHREGRTLLVVTHDPQVAARAQRVLKLCDGLIEHDSLAPSKATHA